MLTAKIFWALIVLGCLVAATIRREERKEASKRDAMKPTIVNPTGEWRYMK